MIRESVNKDLLMKLVRNRVYLNIVKHLYFGE